MPNLKDIRRRIKSVKSTQKITSAMRMVAAAKVRKAEHKMKDARPYTTQLIKVLLTVLGKLQQQASALNDSQFVELLYPRVQKRVALVVITSDRGLCGAYNGNVIKEASRTIEALKAEGKLPSLFLVGNKAIQTLPKRFPDLPLLGQVHGLGTEIVPRQVHTMATTLVSAFSNVQVDGIQVVFTKFRSMVSYQVQNFPLFPLSIESMETLLTTYGVDKEELATSQSTAELDIDPSPSQVLDALIPMFVERVILACLLESIASELASRMTAMANASDNAKKVIHTLSLQYNKARQASITQEIMEIVGGANALAG